MALFRCNFESQAVGISMGMNVIYPQQTPKKAYPTLYLLHGYSDDYTIWQRRTNIERYAQEYELAIVMPDAQRSFYCDFAGIDYAYKYFTFVSEELLNISRNFFHLSDKREDTFVAGLSMGGFGAFKCALNRPDVFSNAASLSGAVDAVALFEREKDRIAEYGMLFGKDVKLEGSENDLIFKAKQVAKELPAATKPRLYQCCGTEDFLYQDNLHFRDEVHNLGLDFTYEEGPGVHDWAFWDAYIQRVLAWLPLKKIEKAE